jgi:hypothetical protein
MQLETRELPPGPNPKDVLQCHARVNRLIDALRHAHGQARFQNAQELATSLADELGLLAFASSQFVPPATRARRQPKSTRRR